MKVVVDCEGVVVVAVFASALGCGQMNPHSLYWDSDEVIRY